jgi:hypothetical protein
VILIGKDKTLRKVSDRVLAEMEPVKEGGKPLEWRRRLNALNIKLKNLKLATSSTIHDKDIEWSLDEDKEPHFSKMLKPSIKEELALSGFVDEEEMRDRLYCTVKNKEDETIVGVERVPRPIKVTVRTGEPTEERENRPGGLYWGNAFALDFDPREEGFAFEIRVPKEHLVRLVAAIKADPNAVMEVMMFVLSFTYEVDDFFSEPWHPRNIILNDGAPSFVGWIGITSKLGTHFVPVSTDDETQKEEPEQITQEQRAHAELMQVMAAYLSPLKSVVTALWVLIVVIALYAVYK